MIRCASRSATIARIRSDIVAFLVFEERDLFSRASRDLHRMLGPDAAPLDVSAFAGREGESFVLYPTRLGSPRLLLIGVGKRAAFTIERLRRAAAFAARTATSLKAGSLAMTEPGDDVQPAPDEDGTPAAIAQCMVEGVLLGSYRFDRYLSDPRRSTLKEFVVVTPDADRAKPIAAGVRRGVIICQAVYDARDLENAPGNELYPESLAAHARTAGRRTGFRVTVHDTATIRRLKMGGLLGVAAGSRRPPRFIIMERKPSGRSRGTIVLVGKGVTFDSGGISIKPAANMAEMKMDMSGAAAVIGTMQAVAQLRLPLRVIGLVPATENMPGGSAFRPGDILRHANGKTSEIDNTDAEGRLILADALSFASRYGPDLVIDLATLTGACVVALGHVASGMMGNDEPGMQRLGASGRRVFERVWQLPMFEEYERLVRSDVADVKNVGGRWAGAITAAMFLKKFIGDYKWIHLDIAGTAIMEETFEYIPKGGSGVGVRLLVDFLEHWNGM